MKDMVENDDPADAMMGLIPFFHSFGFMLMFLNILRGKTMVVLSKFKPVIFLETIVKYKVLKAILIYFCVQFSQKQYWNYLYLIYLLEDSLKNFGYYPEVLEYKMRSLRLVSFLGQEPLY